MDAYYIQVSCLQNLRLSIVIKNTLKRMDKLAVRGSTL